MPSDVAPPVEGAVTPGADAHPGEAVRAAEPTHGDHSNDVLVQEIAAPDIRAQGQRATGQDTGPQTDRGTPRAQDTAVAPGTGRRRGRRPSHGQSGRGWQATPDLATRRRDAHPEACGAQSHDEHRHDEHRHDERADAAGTKRDTTEKPAGAVVLQFRPSNGRPTNGRPANGRPRTGYRGTGAGRRTRNGTPRTEGLPSSAMSRPRNPPHRPASSCRVPGAGCGPGWRVSTRPGSPRPWPRSSSR